MYPAHIRETGERQTVREHCRNTAALAANALRPLGLEKVPIWPGCSTMPEKQEGV